MAGGLLTFDRRKWHVLSMPTEGVRFDRRMLELMDADHDGRIRIDEVLAAAAFLREKGVEIDETTTPSEDDEKALAGVMARRADLETAPPNDEDARAMRAWAEAGKAADVAILGETTASAETALAAVEPLVDAFFTPPADMPLVTDQPDVVLPLKERLNPRHLDAMLDFAAMCVEPILGARESLVRTEWKTLKAKFAPYRAWKASKPVPFAAARAALDDEERVLRYKMRFPEFLRNYMNMDDLYDPERMAIFQVGTLRIDAKELNLCFHVADEATHAALAAQSKCCILYLQLARPSERQTRRICAVVTAGRVGGLYVGRNGVFRDRDGRDWEAVVTRVVEAQVSLSEAFWSPWRKLGAELVALVEKTLGDRQVKKTENLAGLAKDAVAKPEEKSTSGGNGAAMASAVAAIGIAVGMIGAAAASVFAMASRLTWWQIIVAIAAVFFAVSLPSVILAWLKLLRRDLGAILNASGWAINRPMRFSLKLARTFTRI